MSLNFKARKLTRRDTRANQPAATAVAEGTLYYVTDERLLERSTGSAWENVSALTASGQLAFPATQNASTNANTLDDYEEGTWTPGIGGNGGESGQTYSIQTGRYVKVGKMVVAWGRVTLSNKGTLTSFIEITGLPFSSANNANIYGAGLVPYWASLTTAVVHMGIAVNVSSTRAALYATTAAATAAGTLATADLTNTTDIIFSVTYDAAA
jgi:hypothetical protein